MGRPAPGGPCGSRRGASQCGVVDSSNWRMISRLASARSYAAACRRLIGPAPAGLIGTFAVWAKTESLRRSRWRDWCFPTRMWRNVAVCDLAEWLRSRNLASRPT
jgi:hypothetical protein